MNLSSLTIAAAHDKLRSKEISSMELTKACMDRIEATDGTLKNLVYRTFDRALEEAKKIDASGDFSQSPLAGIPYLTKDVFCEAGVPSTVCSDVLRGVKGGKDYIPPFDSTTTALLTKAGAISLGHSNTDQFVMGSSTETSCFGPSHNPWDTTRVPGGSSGGSASAVAADQAIFATGTDTGGSIRQPASYCGVTGLKVTYGRVSRYGVIAMTSSLDTIGPITKTAEDAAIVLQAIAGRDPLDATTPDISVDDYREALQKPLKGLRIGLPKEYFIEGIDPEVEASVRAAAETFKAMGATIEEVSLPHTEYGVATYYVICPCEVASNLARFDGIRFGTSASAPADLLEYYERVRSQGFGAEVKRRIMIGTFALSAGYTDAYYYKALKVRTLVKRDFDEVFKKVDVLLTPTAPTAAFKIGEKANDPVQMYLNDAFTIPGSLAGVPGISVPCGFTKGGLPIGVQILGPHFREDLLLNVAHQYQQSTDWLTRKPSL
jgi:aspartyl-tRNA(Asn)/glutamyl-tRNA(Gln) amidotransferase subunit A